MAAAVRNAAAHIPHIRLQGPNQPKMDCRQAFGRFISRNQGEPFAGAHRRAIAGQRSQNSLLHFFHRREHLRSLPVHADELWGCSDEKEKVFQLFFYLRDASSLKILLCAGITLETLFGGERMAPQTALRPPNLDFKLSQRLI